MTKMTEIADMPFHHYLQQLLSLAISHGESMKVVSNMRNMKNAIDAIHMSIMRHITDGIVMDDMLDVSHDKQM